jgi:hypothetical protein
VNGRMKAASAGRDDKTGKFLQHERPPIEAAYTLSSRLSWRVRVVINSRNKARPAW